MQHARDRIRKLTVRRLLLVEVIVLEINRFLRRWASRPLREFHSAPRKDRNYALMRLTL